MKKQFLTFVFVLLAGITTAFANDVSNVSEQVINSFKKDFATAHDVNWETGKDFIKATFTMNEQVMNAYYEANGKLIAVTRNILSTQLPINLFADVKKDYHSYWISDLFEMASGNETTYYITLENADQAVVLKSSSAGSWIVYKRTRKV